VPDRQNQFNTKREKRSANTGEEGRKEPKYTDCSRLTG
jgi:hypothetical protein